MAEPAGDSTGPVTGGQLVAVMESLRDDINAAIGRYLDKESPQGQIILMMIKQQQMTNALCDGAARRIRELEAGIDHLKVPAQAGTASTPTTTTPKDGTAGSEAH